MKVSSLFSGGKDSVYAVYWAINQAWEVETLVNIIPKRDDSWMFHYPNAWISKLQAEAMGIPIISVETEGDKETEIGDMEKALRLAKENYKVGGVISGALASEYQRIRIETVCHKLGLKSFTPLWHKNQIQLLNDIVSAGFDVIITSVSAFGLDESWLGRKLDKNAVSQLERLQEKYGIWPAGEGGEFETLVLDGPIFKKRIVIDESINEWRGNSGVMLVKMAHLAEKD